MASSGKRFRDSFPWLAALTVAVVSACNREISGGSAGGNATPTQQSALPFEDVTAASGVDWVLRGSRGDRTSLLDTVGFGIAAMDLDADGRQDLVLAGPERLACYRNLGEFRFEAVDVGLDRRGRWAGLAVGDLNNDGWPDLYAAGYGCGALYLNRRGRLVDVTRDWGIQFPSGRYPSWGTSAGMGDLDRDGWLDLVLCRYLDFDESSVQRCKTFRDGITSVCPPKIYPEQRPRVFRNLKGKGFRDVTDAWGFDQAHGAALGVAFQDSDGDGDLDVVIANDERPGDLFVNEGKRFREIGAASGTAYDRQGRVHGGMGMDWGDLDHSGRPDLAVATFFGEDKNLYKNLGDNQFEDVSGRLGFTAPTRTDVAFGLRMFDFDRDGRLDVMVANGHIQENAATLRPELSYPQPLRLFRGTGQSLQPVAPRLWPRLVGRALVTADLENDGDLDVVVGDLEGGVRLFRNGTQTGHWLGVELSGRRSNRMGLGTEVRFQGRSGNRRFEVHTAASYMSSVDPRQVIGLGEETSGRLTLRWPSGVRQTVECPQVDRWIQVVEPTR